MNTKEQELIAHINEVIELKIFPENYRQTLFNIITSEKHIVLADYPLSNTQSEVVDYLITSYTENEEEIMNVEDMSSGKGNFSHILLSSSGHIGIGMFDFSPVEQY